jgi:hypothetical protein
MLDNMVIHRGETLSGYVVTATVDNYDMTIYNKDVVFSDGNGEIIVDSVPDYDVETISDLEVFDIFTYAKNYFDSLKQYMVEMENE